MSIRERLGVRNTKDLITPDTKMCELNYAPAKWGKTTYAATLDGMTKAVHGKPTLIIAVECADGGGTMSIRKCGVDFVQPTTLAKLDEVIGLLGSDEEYGGVVLDNTYDVVKSFVQPYALSLPCRENVSTRKEGVPTRSDYQVMGELLRTRLTRLVALTVHPNLKVRKHLLVTGLLKKKEDENGVISFIGPDLPGAMATSSPAVFQTVTSITVKNEVVGGQRTTKRLLQVSPNAGGMIVGDRMGVLPDQCELDKLVQWEKYWKPLFVGE